MTDGDLDADGYAFVRGAFGLDEVEEIRRQVADAIAVDDPAVLANDGPAYGARELLRLWPGAVELVRRGPLRDVLLSCLGTDAGIVRGLYFDKPPGHSWALPWHRDYTIAVREHRPSDRFVKQTIKAGVPHVEAPQELLERMLTARIHLDDMASDNGPLRVIPGSHRFADHRPPVTLACRAGDVLLMRPLLSHASAHSDPVTTRHRRIVHLECAADPDLDDGFAWREYHRLA